MTFRPTSAGTKQFRLDLDTRDGPAVLSFAGTGAVNAVAAPPGAPPASPHLRVTPNPCADALMVSIEHASGEAALVIVDALGRICATHHITATRSEVSTCRIDVRPLAEGAYRILCRTPQGSTSSPLLIVR